MTIQIIQYQRFFVLLKINGRTYHWWMWRTLTIYRKGTYQATTKQGQLGWYTPDGWISYAQLKRAINLHKQ